MALYRFRIVASHIQDAAAIGAAIYLPALSAHGQPKNPAAIKNCQEWDQGDHGRDGDFLAWAILKKTPHEDWTCAPGKTWS
jgi:hypothetical protein